MTFGSLFAGIGGFDLGLERAGMRCSWQVEIDPYCQRVLAKHWPDVERLEDVRECGAHNLEPVDLICGGFPCQPVSCAGKRQGDADARWLWPEYHRIIRELKPRWVVGENVPGLLSANAGRLFGGILRDLAACGYVVEWDCIPAAAVGAPHRRDRVWIVAHSRSVGMDLERRGIAGASGQGSVFADRHGPVWDVADADSGRQQECPQLDSQAPHDTSNRGASGEHAYRCRDAVADADSDGRGGVLRQTRSGADGPELGADIDREGPGKRRAGPARAVPDTNQERLENGFICAKGQAAIGTVERSRGSDGVWAVEPDVGRVAHGVPAWVDRLRALGNAIVPQVAEWIGQRIVEAEA